MAAWYCDNSVLEEAEEPGVYLRPGV